MSQMVVEEKYSLIWTRSNDTNRICAAVISEQKMTATNWACALLTYLITFTGTMHCWNLHRLNFLDYSFLTPFTLPPLSVHPEFYSCFLSTFLLTTLTWLINLFIYLFTSLLNQGFLKKFLLLITLFCPSSNALIMQLSWFPFEVLYFIVLSGFVSKQNSAAQIFFFFAYCNFT